MAESLNTTLGNALVALIDWTWPSVEPLVRPALETIGETLRPHPPLSIITVEGESLTGVIVADRGRVLAFLGTRQAPPPPGQQRLVHDDAPY